MKENREKETSEQSAVLAPREAKPITASTPFMFMRRFATDMERLFEEFQGFRFPSLFGREFFPFTREFEHVGWVPELEVLQNNEEFVVRADLPGLKRDDVKVELTNDILTISGERKDEKEEKREGYYRSERSYGSFYRQIPLPEGAKIDTAKAEFTDGVLEITMQAPAREPQKRQLEINEGANAATAKAAAAK
ncbi:MAG TPA: Hsp20/alpha crystallin family protein [Pyrinomonadaceae bacterium]|nr:Hsp20/alpha crystallin family protein [Pyrinomonadaceae bacterium]